MKYMNRAKKFASKTSAKVSVGILTVIALSSPARAEGIDDIWAAIDLSGMSAKVIAAGVLIIGIAMALKSIALGKRTVNKA